MQFWYLMSVDGEDFRMRTRVLITNFFASSREYKVHYCAEQFLNDGSVASALLKALKRTMAGEFSRELSEKVFAGQCRIVQNGFKIGGRAGYGLRRMLLDTSGSPKVILRHGEQKSLTTERVIYI